MNWSETEISAALDGHFYAVVYDQVARTIDLAINDAPRKPSVWTLDELRQLVDLKRKGLTLDALEAELNRDRRTIREMWVNRDEWLESLAHPAPQPPADGKPVSTAPQGQVTLAKILQTVCAVYGIDKAEFCGIRRGKHLANARHVFFWICRNFTERSLPHIGKLACRDHSTALYGAEKVQAQFEKYQPAIERCLAVLGLQLEQRRGAA